MKTLAFNPYLPQWEHIPDGEPRVFGDRVYIYGSHDEDDGQEFCLLDYVCWSAPVDDLGNWKYEGVIYRKEQEPLQQDKSIPGIPDRMAQGLPHLLFAPDVVQGRDGRYYLYYSMDFSNMISVAVCDTPGGQYEFLSHVKRADGTRPEGIQWFDPGVLCDESGVYLYMGSAPEVRFPEMGDAPIPGGMGVRLADDMHTIIGEPFVCADELTMNPDGTFSQAEITSCGLNGGPLPAKHTYPAAIACCLMGPDRETMGMLPLKPENGPKNPIPYHTGAKNEFAEGGYRSRIENLRPGAVFGFKYLDFGDSASHLTMTLRGTGAVSLRLDDPGSGEVAALSVDSGAWAAVSADFKPITGVHAVYFSVIGSADDKIACTDFQFH